MQRAAAQSEATAVEADPQLVYPIGMMMLLLAAFSVPFHLAKQSQIIAMICVGVIFGPVLQLHESLRLSTTTAASLFDLGILFVLFMGGMEVDLDALKRGWSLVLINGLGMIFLNFAFFTGIALALFQDASTVGLIYFGLCCTLSSTILVLGSLKKRGDMEALHGQIILGLMVLQDVCAVVGIALMPAFDPAAVDPDIVFTIGYLLLWFVALLICLYMLNRWVLTRVFRYCAVSSELLFIAVYAYSLGIASIFGWFLPTINGSSFSQEIGIFFAGVSIAALEYRVQIETFVEPIKEFGVLLFFFILGITLPSDTQTLLDSLLPGLLLGGLTVFVCPALMWLTGALSGLDSRCCFMMGNTVNQISEFSLILANGAKALGIFSNEMYLTIVVATLITFVFSSMGHVFADVLYDNIFKRALSSLDRWCRVKEKQDDTFRMHHHVVLLGFNAIALEIAEYYRAVGQDVLVIQLDPRLHHDLSDWYSKGQAKTSTHVSPATTTSPVSAPPDTSPPPSPHRAGHGGCGTNIYSQYADPTNPDTWHHYHLHHASMVVSCHHGTTESNCVLAHELKQHRVPFLCLADSHSEALVLYEAGVRFVIQADAMAAHTFQRHLYDAKLSKCSFLADVAMQHRRKILSEQHDPHRAKLSVYL